MVRNIAGVLIAIGTGERPVGLGRRSARGTRSDAGRRDRAAGGLVPGRHPLCRRAGSAQRAAPTSCGAACPVRAGPSIDAALSRPDAADRDRHDLVRKDHAFADQDRAPHALGARRSVDEVRRLRRGAVSRGAGAQSARVSEVRTSHAHRRARAARSFPRSGSVDGAGREHRAGGSAQVSRHARSIATACSRRRRPRRRRMR